MKAYQSLVEKLILPAGIQTNNGYAADLTIHDSRFYKRVLRDGSLGFGETYMEGWWDSPFLDNVLYKLLRANLEKRVKNNLQIALRTLQSKLFNQQSIARAVEASKKHYDFGNEFFECILDKYMLYSCAYWENAVTLDEAQENKLELICKKLMLTPGQSVLDIGCGWGGFARYAAERYKVKVTGITNSAEQARFAQKTNAGLPVTIKLQDYRELYGNFDRIVSIGMFEHVGLKNYANFMKVAHRCLSSNGIFLLHCIGGNESVVKTDDWINRYIFPNGMMPSIKQIGASIETRFVMKDWHNFGLHYDRTLMEWLRNLRTSRTSLCKKYGERFYRMWEYYLSLSAASFRAGKNQLWQIILTHEDYYGEYQSIR